MSFTKGEVNKDHNVNAAFDMSSNTELSLIYTLHDSTTVTKTSADGVVLGTAPITDPDIGPLLANQYVIYPIEAGFLSQAGTWNVYVQYENSVTGDVFIGKCAEFTVDDVTCE